MGAQLNVVERNVHEVQVDASRMLFHVPSSSLFSTDALTAGIIDSLRDSSCTAEELQKRLPVYDADDVDSMVQELTALEVISDGRPLTPEIGNKRVERVALSTVVLNVNTGCNLSCTYCYKEDLVKPSAGLKMDIDTAVASIEMLLKESPDEQRYTVVFFGGEPLTRLIHEYAD